VNQTADLYPTSLNSSHAIAISFLTLDILDFQIPPHISIVTKDLAPDIEESFIHTLCQIISVNDIYDIKLSKTGIFRANESVYFFVGCADDHPCSVSNHIKCEQ
jgi:hypothetical protein